MKLITGRILSQKDKLRLEEIFKNPAIATTTSLGRVRGFTIDLLFHLKDGPKRCCELGKITGKCYAYVHIYLRNMRKYGLAKKNGLFWEITCLGVDFFDYLDIVYNNIIEYEKKRERREKEERKITPKKSKQLSISVFSGSTDLSDCERRVVEVLLAHYNKTGQKFKFVADEYAVCELLGFPITTVREAFRNLHSENIAYLFRNRTYNCWKIALKKSFVELLERAKVSDKEIKEYGT